VSMENTNLIVTDIGVKRFCYCPRWFYINYILGFRPKTPIKAKFIIGDAFQKLIATRLPNDYLERSSDLARSEEMAEEDVPWEEMQARGEILKSDILRWVGTIQNVTWQEKLVRFAFDEEPDIILESYPKMVGDRQGITTLFNFRTAYDIARAMDFPGYYYAFVIQTLGLEKAGINPKQHALLNLIIRTRKERHSNRAKTPITEIKEDLLSFNLPFYKAQLLQLVRQINSCRNTNNFPALGVIDGTCTWCPNGRVMQDKMLCEYPDDILKRLSESSLQRTSIERWRDEF